LAAWNAAVVIVTALLTLLGLRQGVQWALLREVDQVLVEDANEISLALKRPSYEGLPHLKEELLRKAVGHKQRGWYVKLCDARDAVVWATPGAPNETPRIDATSDETPWTVNDYRTVRREIPKPVDGIEVIRVGATLKHVRDDVARIDRWVLLAAVPCVDRAAMRHWLAARLRGGRNHRSRLRMRPAHLGAAAAAGHR
jgi:hypothetical protein